MEGVDCRKGWMNWLGGEKLTNVKWACFEAWDDIRKCRLFVGLEGHCCCSLCFVNCLLAGK